MNYLKISFVDLRLGFKPPTQHPLDKETRWTNYLNCSIFTLYIFYIPRFANKLTLVYHYQSKFTSVPSCQVTFSQFVNKFLRVVKHVKALQLAYNHYQHGTMLHNNHNAMRQQQNKRKTHMHRRLQTIVDRNKR